MRNNPPENVERSEFQRDERGPWRVSRRLRLVLVGAGAGSLCGAFVLGWADAIIIALTLVALARIIRRPRPVQFTTAVILTVVTGIALWANLKPTRWHDDVYGYRDTPEHLDPVTRAMFWRGWPVCPFMLCPFRHMTFLPEEGLPQQALVYNAVLLLATLLGTRSLCERFFRRRRRPASPPDRVQPAQAPLLRVVTNGLAKGLLWGVGFGLLDLALLAVWEEPISFLLDLRDPGVYKVFDSVDRAVRSINAPADWLASPAGWLWQAVALCHRWLEYGEMGGEMDAIRLCAVLIQWGFIGMVVGMVVALLRRYHPRTRPASSGDG